jgi:hypothetical protein
MGADGSIITTNEQVQEVWTGATFGLAALMLSDGLKDEAYRTAWGVYHVNYETRLLVPHARSLGYQRQLSRVHVHAPGSDLGYGNDCAAQVSGMAAVNGLDACPLARAW